jgi:hypothetical protein
MAEGAGLALESRKSTLQKFYEMEGIELWPIDVEALRVTNSVTNRVLSRTYAIKALARTRPEDPDSLREPSHPVQGAWSARVEERTWRVATFRGD